ncbi:MAG: poly(A) polymerase [Thermodesulfobacteriota bacterium]
MTVSPDSAPPPAAAIEPRRIPRAEHPISRRFIDREALKVMYRLKDAGFIAYLVGGGVRDLYLGKTPKDFDIGTDARPGQVRKLFRNSRIIGRRFRLVQIIFPGGKIVEVSTFRSQAEFELGGEEPTLGPDNTFGTPEEDAWRRDLTINALFYSLDDLSIIDYTGGVRDLDAGIIRAIGDPDRRFHRDPVRMLRAIRHAARNSFTIEPVTWAAILSHGEKLALCPVSRLRDEVTKDLRGGASRTWGALAVSSGLFGVLFPAYGEILPGHAELEAGLTAALGVVDRLQREGVELDEATILGLVALPRIRQTLATLWPTDPRQKSGAFAARIQDEVERILAPLEFKRATRDRASLLLATYPFFDSLRLSGAWPKRLARKSYFPDCVAFCQLAAEAAGGPAVAQDQVLASRRPEGERPDQPRRDRRHGRAPVLGRRGKGGIFGLKKE